MPGLLRRFAPLAVLAGAAFLGAARPSEAAFSITLTQGSTTITISDGGANDQSSLSGVITYNAMNFGAFQDIEITVRSNSPGSTNPSLGGTLRDITLTTRNASSGDATLELFASADNYSIPLGDPLILKSSLASDFFVGMSSSAKATFDSTLISGAATTSAPQVSLTSAGLATSSTTASRPDSTYTLQNTLRITLGAQGAANFNATTQALLPEPGTMAMAFLAAPLLGLGYRVRRRRAQA